VPFDALRGNIPTRDRTVDVEHVNGDVHDAFDEQAIGYLAGDSWNGTHVMSSRDSPEPALTYQNGPSGSVRKDPAGRFHS